MEKHESFSDEAIVEQFESEVLPIDVLTHVAQIRLVWIYLNKVGRSKSQEEILHYLDQYLKINNCKIEVNKRLANQTIRVLDIYRRSANTNSFQSFMDRFPDLIKNTAPIISFH